MQAKAPKGSKLSKNKEVQAECVGEGGVTGQAYGIGHRAVSHLHKNNKTVKAAEKLTDQLISFLIGKIPEDLEKGKAKEQTKDLLSKVASLHAAVKRDKEVLDTYMRLGGLIGMTDEVLQDSIMAQD